MGLSNHPGPINIGNPREISLLELAEIVTKVVGGSGEMEFKPLPEDDPKTRNPNIQRAKDILGWSPIVEIEDGILRTAEWMRSLKQ